MNEIIFEKVGDIGTTYPYICVYINDRSKPFMEIAVTDEKSLAFTFYPIIENMNLTLADWDQIREKAVAFLPKAIDDEEASLLD